jgi:hypothetical protein
MLCSDILIEAFTVSSTLTDSMEIRNVVTIYPEIFEQYMYSQNWNRNKTVSIKTNSITNDITSMKKTINVTHVAIKSFAFSGIKLCNSSILSDGIMDLGMPCSCEIGCTTSCCVDYALTYYDVTSCINTAYPPELIDFGGFVVIDKCFSSEANQYLSVQCNTSPSNFTDFLHTMPLTDTQNDVSYKNIFCFLCNVGTGTLNKTPVLDLRVLPWKLFVVCREFINPDYFPILTEFIIMLKSLNCNFKLNPSTYAKTCDRRKPEVSRCNTTGLWSDEDVDIKRSCEATKQGALPLTGPNGKYKNVFCHMCNPESEVAGDIISSCRISTPSTRKDACEKLPYVQMSSNYKNLFCAICNDFKPRSKYVDKFEDFVIHSAMDIQEHGRVYNYSLFSAHRKNFIKLKPC